MLLFVAVPMGAPANGQTPTRDYQGLGTFPVRTAVPACSRAGRVIYRTAFANATVIAVCKVAELAIMLAGLAAVLFVCRRPHELAVGLDAVLHCAVPHGIATARSLGPGKYGILPPSCSANRKCPPRSGIIPHDHVPRHHFWPGPRRWIESQFKDNLLPIRRRVRGTGDARHSHLAVDSPHASPAMSGWRFNFEMLLVPREIVRLLLADSTLHGALWSSSAF